MARWVYLPCSAWSLSAFEDLDDIKCIFGIESCGGGGTCKVKSCGAF